jgi:hypothetical protein
MLRDRGATCAEAVHGDFLDADPLSSSFALVSHILLDPSCSSSGMSSNPVADADALEQLAAAQQALVLHAMRFPNLQASRSHRLRTPAPRTAPPARGIRTPDLHLHSSPRSWWKDP